MSAKGENIKTIFSKSYVCEAVEIFLVFIWVRQFHGNTHKLKSYYKKYV